MQLSAKSMFGRKLIDMQAVEGVLLAREMASAKPNSKLPESLPILLIDGVLFPGATIRIPARSEKNLKMVKEHLLSRSILGSTIIGVVPRAKDSIGEDNVSDLHPIGTAGIVIQLAGRNWPHPTYTLLVTGLCRFKLESFVSESPYLIAKVSQLDRLPEEKSEAPEANSELALLMEKLKTQAMKLIDVMGLSGPVLTQMKNLLNTLPAQSLPDVCAALIKASHEERLQILDALDLAVRYRKTLPLLTRQIKDIEVSLAKVDDELSDITKLLKRPMKIFDGMEKNDEVAVLEKKIKEMDMPDYARKVALKEIQRLKKMYGHTPDHALTRNYVELMTDLPWNKCSPEIMDLNKSRADLDADHYGMDKLKKRVVEYLAVRQLKCSLKGPIMCFVGPPGVGKTSVGKSIARSLGKEFHRISVGGISDQSDIRGHKRTYIGSMPGRIIQGLKTVGVKNPVFLLDEIDKMGSGHHGDPAAALLEVLDPEQNCSFTDHYLNVPFDLSQVLFIATANRTDTIPPALLDRMEVISVSGYTHEEKEHIAQDHLIPKQLKEHGLTPEMLQLTNEVIKLIIQKYTKEAGVRGLERKIGALCRAVAVKIVEKQTALSTAQEVLVNVEGSVNSKAELLPPSEVGMVLMDKIVHPPELPFVLDEEAVVDILGPPVYDGDIAARVGQPGVAFGLSCTIAGGHLLYVEATKVDGDGELILTGQLGEVMKESAKLALNWVRSHAKEYGILMPNGKDIMDATDVHIHFPAGSVSKEGPSAGVAIITVLVSLFTGRLVRSDVAMTGEVTLRGLVLPVGGIKDKVLAAHRGGLKCCILPRRNKSDLHEIPENIRNEMTFHFATHVDDVLQVAFEGGFPNVSKKVDLVISKL